MERMNSENIAEKPDTLQQSVHSLVMREEAAPDKKSFCGGDLLIGARLRAFRKRKGLSIRSLAKICGISVNTLSLIENDRISPNVNTLKQVADGLEISIASFFEEDHPERSVIYQRQGQRLKIPFSNGALEKLGQGFPPLGAEPILVTLETTSNEVQVVAHPGREFIYCLEGAVTCELAGQAYPLFSGDSLLFNASIPHRWINSHTHPSRLLVLFCALETHEQPAELHLDRQTRIDGQDEPPTIS